VLVTATSPTPAGEGKTTTTVGCGVARNRIVAKGTCVEKIDEEGKVMGLFWW
jgi:formate--tetrahydrofolate ligase